MKTRYLARVNGEVRLRFELVEIPGRPNEVNILTPTRRPLTLTGKHPVTFPPEPTVEQVATTLNEWALSQGSGGWWDPGEPVEFGAELSFPAIRYN